MSNRWGIPAAVEKIVRERDTACVYCGISFLIVNNSRKNMPSWEHIINDIQLNNSDNIALCCISCNASKGAKPLGIWLKSEYCESKNINDFTVAKIIQKAIKNGGG